MTTLPLSNVRESSTTPPAARSMLIFSDRGVLVARFACAVLLPLGIFLSMVLYFSGHQWGLFVLIVITVLICLYWPVTDRVIAYVGAADDTGAGGGLPVQQRQQQPPMMARPRMERVRRSGGGVQGLGTSAIEALPSYAYEKKRKTSGDGGAEEDDCAVCLGELQRGETVKQLPACAHLFHDRCIDAWLRTQVTCPVCRFPVNTQALPAETEIYHSAES